jgi:hypothetical protein
LKWGVGFRDEGADARVNVGPVSDNPAAFRQDCLTQVDDRLDIFQGFRRMADHEVQLDGWPATAIDFTRGLKQLGSGYGLIDDLAHVFRGCFRSKRKTAAPVLHHGIH